MAVRRALLNHEPGGPVRSVEAGTFVPDPVRRGEHHRAPGGQQRGGQQIVGGILGPENVGNEAIEGGDSLYEKENTNRTLAVDKITERVESVLDALVDDTLVAGPLGTHPDVIEAIGSLYRTAADQRVVPAGH